MEKKLIIVKLRDIRDVGFTVEVSGEMEEEWIIAELRDDGLYYEVAASHDPSRLVERIKKLKQ